MIRLLNRTKIKPTAGFLRYIVCRSLTLLNSTLRIFHTRRGFLCLMFSMTPHILETCSHMRCKSRSEMKLYVLTCRMETLADVMLIAANWDGKKQLALMFLSLTHSSLRLFTKFLFQCLFTQFIYLFFLPFKFSSISFFSCFRVFLDFRFFLGFIKLIRLFLLLFFYITRQMPYEYIMFVVWISDS
jgi:hypothetical protein